MAAVLGISTKAEKSPFPAETPALPRVPGLIPTPGGWRGGPPPAAQPADTLSGLAVTPHVPRTSRELPRPPSPVSRLTPGHTATHWGSPAAPTSVIQAFPFAALWPHPALRSTHSPDHRTDVHSCGTPPSVHTFLFFPHTADPTFSGGRCS